MENPARLGEMLTLIPLLELGFAAGRAIVPDGQATIRGRGIPFIVTATARTSVCAPEPSRSDHDSFEGGP
jgi:hypothetical protein